MAPAAIHPSIPPKPSMTATDDSLLAVLVEMSHDVLVVADDKGAIAAVNKGLHGLCGLSEEEVVGRPWWSLFADGDDQRLIREVERALTERGRWQGDLRLTCADGRICRTEADVRRVRSGGGSAEHSLVFLRDITQAAQHFDQERLRIQYDPLTHLPNRFLLHDRLERALIVARRADQSVALLRLGIDHFNRVNDGLGHANGDMLLTAVAQRLKHTVRRSDTIARLEGDQFALVLAMKSADDAVIVAQKLLAAIQAPFPLEGHEVSLTASIGIALFPSDYQKGDELLKGANSAMHHAKRLGRNGYQFYSHEMNERAKQRLTLENELRRALLEEQFVLYFQPKVDIASGAVVGAEALVRWRHPQRGLVPPGEFIPVAEESGLIGALGEWVLKDACLRNAEWQRRGLKPIRVSVNVSAPQFRTSDIIERIAAALAASGLGPKWLELEITESMLMGNPDLVAQKLHALRRLGIHIAIDDFGTGYSSLSYLSRFPITTLKIDRSFIRDIATNHGMAEITRAIIGLSKGLELEVVAEGAETAEHIAFLREYGCVTVQGFFYSRPVPAEEFEKVLAEGFSRGE